MSLLRVTGSMLLPPSHFSVCYAHGCNRSADVKLSGEEWNIVREAFDLGSSDTAKERQSIAKAVDILKQSSGDAPELMLI